MSIAQRIYALCLNSAIIIAILAAVFAIAFVILTWPLPFTYLQSQYSEFKLGPICFVKKKWKVPSLIVGFAVASLSFVANLVQLNMWEPIQPPLYMDAAFNVAVAGFDFDGADSDQSSAGFLANALYSTIKNSLEHDQYDISIAVAGPKEVGKISGDRSQDRAKLAAILADRINAHLVVYGRVSQIPGGWELTPEFYVSDRSFFRAQEITYDYKLGNPIVLNSLSEAADSVRVSQELNYRVSALVHIIKGLASYVYEDYSGALAEFSAAKDIELERQFGSEDVINLLVGNAALKLNDFEGALEAYLASLAANREYARAYIGIADTYYLHALEKYDIDGENYGIDFGLLDLAEEYVAQALAAEDRSQIADIETKAHFQRGQIEIVRAWSRQDQDYSSAIKEFSEIVDTYSSGRNLRIQEYAAESHARLGLIYYLQGNTTQAVSEYRAAIELLPANSARRALYESRVQAILDPKASGSDKADEEILP